MDASVGVKWFLPEVHAAEARQWRNGPDELHVPSPQRDNAPPWRAVPYTFDLPINWPPD